MVKTVIPPGLALQAWDWNGIIGTGQSLSVGARAEQLRSTEPSYRNLMLGWERPSWRRELKPLDALVPLREPIRPFAKRFPGPYPYNIYGETPHTAMASEITSLFLALSEGAGDYVSVHTVVGESGQALRVIAQGATRTDDAGHAFEASLLETRTLSRLAKAAQRSFGIAAVILTHGESDATNPDYARGLSELWRSYNTALPPLTGQTRAIPLLLTQQSSCPAEPGSTADSALAAWVAANTHEGDIVCVGPRYQYGYVADGVHLDALAYDQLGEKYGQAYFEHVVRGRPWRALEPHRVTCAGRKVRVDFQVPVAPLIWDERMPPGAAHPAWVRGRGFEVSAGAEPLEILSARIDGDSVELTLGRDPPTEVRVGYALTAAAAPRPHGAQRWGQLRDADPFVGATTGTAAPNFAVTFQSTARCEGAASPR